MTEPPQTFLLVVDPSRVAAVTELASAHDVEVEHVPQRGIEPVTTVTLALVGAAAAVSTVQHVFFEQRKGGQVIDLRPGAQEMLYRTPNLIYGIVVIIAVDGTVTVTARKPDGAFARALSGLPRMLPGGSSAQQVIGVVTGAFGTDVEVETSAVPPGAVPPGDGAA